MDLNNLTYFCRSNPICNNAFFFFIYISFTVKERHIVVGSKLTEYILYEIYTLKSKILMATFAKGMCLEMKSYLLDINVMVINMR